MPKITPNQIIPKSAIAPYVKKNYIRADLIVSGQELIEIQLDKMADYSYETSRFFMLLAEQNAKDYFKKACEFDNYPESGIETASRENYFVILYQVEKVCLHKFTKHCQSLSRNRK